MAAISSLLPRWLRRPVARTKDDAGKVNDRDLDYVDCHACTQVGYPLFHSASYNSAQAQHLQWQATAGSCFFFQAQAQSRSTHLPGRGPFGPILDPRWDWVRKWNQAVLLARGVTLAVDPLFFYVLSLSLGRGGAPCVRVGYVVAGTVTLLRTCLDALHLWHVWAQLRMAYVSRESLVVGLGKLVWDARAIVSHYVGSVSGFWVDLFVTLPIPQAVLWLLVPHLIKAEKMKLVFTTLILTFSLQFIPKIYHSFCLVARMQRATGYIFDNVWLSFGLGIILYLVASHVIGGCWYVLAMDRVFSCLKQQCELQGVCNLSSSCAKDVCYQFINSEDIIANPCGINMTAISKPMCLDEDGPFRYGIYANGLLVVTSHSLANKILYPIFWGLLNLSSFANNLSPTSDMVETSFCIFIVLCGMLFFTVMVGNIQVFLSIMLDKYEKMQLRRRDLEWWMNRRQLPGSLRRRVRHFELQMWEVLGGEDQTDWIDELPEGLRRDIKQYLCLDLIKKVPLFHKLDDLVLENICDRVKPLVFSKNEKINREGDPVPRMVFIVRGQVKRCQNLVKGKVATSVIRPGGFIGEELICWCLRRPFVDRLPSSSATFTCTKSMEAFSIEATDLRFITDHFRYRFARKWLMQTVRYYSSNWQTWAAVIIQFAWRRHMARSAAAPTVVCGGRIETQLGQYAAVFMSLKPHDHLD